jgi:hypothetical protein
MRLLAIPVLLALLPCSPLLGQSGPFPVGEMDFKASTAPPLTGFIIPAVRIQGEAPNIDGFLNDEAWSMAPVATDFVQMEPQEGEPATERTEVRILYGAEALFVAFRAFDSEPEGIAGQLTRRDADSYSDVVHIVIDSYFDRRTAFHFAVNPVGVKTDLYRFNDTDDDSSWDAVWDVATLIDEQGWTAEFRIPYSQLRFGNHDDQTWGINFAREIARRNEMATWAPIRQSDAAVVSKSGELRGLKGLGTPSRMELRPFTLARLTHSPEDPGNPFQESTEFFPSGGLDLKYGVTNDLTLDVTVNPDFGQVEADPAQVNLSAFESFYPEQRPFFIEGASIYAFNIGIGDGDMGSESLFYSRRIGRPPQGWPDTQGGFADVPETSTILGAWKLSGKTQDGWSIGLLHAVTAEETASVTTGQGVDLEKPVEPLSNYAVARIQKDFREGRSAVGFIGTAANRNPEVANALLLRTGAYAGGFDFRHRFGEEEKYLANGYILGSHVRGSEEAMALTQIAPARYFQRPDADHTTLDPTLTSLNGWAGKLEFMKVADGYWRWGSTVTAKSPGFEPNDLGFQRESDLLLQVGFVGYDHYTPSEKLRRWNLNANAWHGWSFGGERLATGANINGSLTLLNYWGGYGGINQDFEAFSDGTLRGGPLVRREARSNGWFGFFSDSRKAVQANLANNWSRAADSDSWSWNSSLDLRWRTSGRMNMSLGPFLNRSVNDLQWVGRYPLDENHYLFGQIDQRTFGLTGRFDYTFKPDLTLQLYAQPFISAGIYQDFKQVNDPLAESYSDRYAPVEVTRSDDHYLMDLDGDGESESFRVPDFNFKQFRSTVVLRWEYRPGSLLYLVWSQGRDHYDMNGDFNLGNNMETLFRQNAENVFMLKMSYWIAP